MKKIFLFFIMIFILVSFGCRNEIKEEETKYKVNYYEVLRTFNNNISNPQYEYEAILKGVEEVVEGKCAKGILEGDNQKYQISTKNCYLQKEYSEKGAVLFDFSTPITSDIDLYAKKDTFVFYYELDNSDNYTLNLSVSDLPDNLNWNPFITTNDLDFQKYMITNFFEYDFNVNKDGYSYKPALAACEPVDVSKDYVGDDWKIKANETGKAWEVTLRPDLCFNDGMKITNEDFVNSAKRLLNIDASNANASKLFFNDEFIIHNAYQYFNQRNEAYIPLKDLYSSLEEAINDNQEIYIDYFCCNQMALKFFNNTFMSAKGRKNISNLFTIYEDSTTEIGTRTIKLYQNGNQWSFFNKYVSINATDKRELLTEEMIEGFSDCDNFINNIYNYDLGDLCTVKKDDYTIDFDKVGIIAKGSDKLVFIFDNNLTELEFKERVQTFLVKTDLYDSCNNLNEKQELNTNEAYTSSYCTSLETSCSYGPYEIFDYKENEYLKLKRNDNWWGYKLIENDGLYQATNINYYVCNNENNATELMNYGKLDQYAYKNYQDTDDKNRYYQGNGTTYFISFNPNPVIDEENEYRYEIDSVTCELIKCEHRNVDKQILNIKEFRQAFNLAFNRQEFNKFCNDSNNPAYSFFTNDFSSSLNNGIIYNNTVKAKMNLINLYGLKDEIGTNKKYKDVNEAYQAILNNEGYNLTRAKELFNIAFDKAKALNYIDEDDCVEITVETMNNTSLYYGNGFNYIKETMKKAVVGTKLEGRLTFVAHQGYSAAGISLENHKVDLTFGFGYRSAFDELYSLVNDLFLYNFGVALKENVNDLQCEITLPVRFVEGINSIESKVYLANACDLAQSVDGATIKLVSKEDTDKSFDCNFGLDCDDEIRSYIVSIIEYAILKTYMVLPLSHSGMNYIVSDKISYPNKTSIYGIELGGIKYLKFNYNDKEWINYLNK